MRRRHLFTVPAVMSLLAGSLLFTAPAAAAAVPSCPGAAPSVGVFKAGGVPALDWRENLVFDGHGTMWVSHVLDSTVEGYGPDGRLKAKVSVSTPGGLRIGHDGLVYVASGEIPIGGAGIERFDPTAARPVATTFVKGLSGINGLAEDASGNFYATAEFAGNVTKINANGSVDQSWTDAANIFGTNGAFVDGDTLYVSRTVDPASSIVRIPLSNPGAHSIVTKLSPAVIDYKGLDDLTVIGDDIYALGFGSGQLYRIDKTSGATCVALNGLRLPTSVRVPTDFDGHDSAHRVFITEATGRILNVSL